MAASNEIVTRTIVNTAFAAGACTAGAIEAATTKGAVRLNLDTNPANSVPLFTIPTYITGTTGNITPGDGTANFDLGAGHTALAFGASYESAQPALYLLAIKPNVNGHQFAVVLTDLLGAPAPDGIVVRFWAIEG